MSDHATTGQRVEDLKLYGFQPDQILSQDERRGIVEFAFQFEECTHSWAELEDRQQPTQ